jgi:hypothetical protein
LQSVDTSYGNSVASQVYPEFEWDDAKAAENISKHGVGFPEAVTAFRDKFAIDYFDDIDYREDRLFTSVFPVGSY